jgi:hypothetical protein
MQSLFLCFDAHFLLFWPLCSNFELLTSSTICNLFLPQIFVLIGFFLCWCTIHTDFPSIPLLNLGLYSNFFLVVLEFEFRALCLLGSRKSHYACLIDWDRVLLFAWTGFKMQSILLISASGVAGFTRPQYLVILKQFLKALPRLLYQK